MFISSAIKQEQSFRGQLQKQPRMTHHFVRDRVDHEEADRGQDATDVVRKVPRLWMDRGRIDCDPPPGEELQTKKD